MNKKEYRRKVAEIFSFKSPRSEKVKAITAGENLPTQKQTGEDENNTMASVKQESNTAQLVKKRDVIVIGAGLSGE